MIVRGGRLCVHRACAHIKHGQGCPCSQSPCFQLHTNSLVDEAPAVIPIGASDDAEGAFYGLVEGVGADSEQVSVGAVEMTEHVPQGIDDGDLNAVCAFVEQSCGNGALVFGIEHGGKILSVDGDLQHIAVELREPD